jgi:cysteinyl-tRNA synthetase
LSVALRFYNTLGRRVEPFEPLEPGRVRMYTCGPTVYDRAHIGNFRTFVWEDLLRRWLRVRGYDVEQVMNLTDVDDKTIRAAVERGATLAEVTRPVERQFFEDWETLGLEPVEHHPRATEHVDDMIALIRRLEEAGLTYERDGSIYYAIDHFDGYGRLVDLDPATLHDAGRASGDEEYTKDDPRDFVLWKGGTREDEGGVAVWDSPWGPGRPGWHLECSAMAMHYLGDTLDIHTGGVDNIFPHHVNEMAQSEAATGEPFARYWLHAAHLLVDGGKMSKSLGNFHTIGSLLERGARPSAIRYLLLSAHYRSQLNFTLEGLEGAERAVTRLWEFRARLDDAVDAAAVDGGRDAAEEMVETWRASFDAAMDDDLGVSGALAATFDLVRDGNAALDAGRLGSEGAGVLRGAMDRFDQVFGVLALRAHEEEIDDPEFVAWVDERIEARAQARAERDFARADAVREELEARGVVLEDTPSGTRWKRASADDLEGSDLPAGRS